MLENDGGKKRAHDEYGEDGRGTRTRKIKKGMLRMRIRRR